MGKHLTVISYPREQDSYFEAVTLTANSGDGHLFVRCQRVNQLSDYLANEGRDADLLDLVGHGSESHLDLGDETLLLSHRDPPESLRGIGQLLAPGARIRLLGCYTGVDKNGRALIRRAADFFKVEVLGTRVLIEPPDFSSTGFRPDAAPEWFVSSNMKTEVPPIVRFGPTPVPGIAKQWSKVLPGGYQVAGRMQPMARKDISFHYAGTKVSFACEGRLVLIEDQPRLPPIVLCWDKPGSVPILSKLLQPFGIH